MNNRKLVFFPSHPSKSPLPKGRWWNLLIGMRFPIRPEKEQENSGSLAPLAHHRASVLPMRRSLSGISEDQPWIENLPQGKDRLQEDDNQEVDFLLRRLKRDEGKNSKIPFATEDADKDETLAHNVLGYIHEDLSLKEQNSKKVPVLLFTISVLVLSLVLFTYIDTLRLMHIQLSIKISFAIYLTFSILISLCILILILNEMSTLFKVFENRQKDPLDPLSHLDE